MKRPDRAYYMQKVMELSVKELRNRHKVVKPADVLYIVEGYGYADQEHFIGIYLDGAQRVITSRVITLGLLNRTLLHPREVYRPAIELCSASLIVCHNHPSGTLEPSREDREGTTRLAQAGKLLGIELLDHLIIGRGEFYSFRESGDVFLS